MKSQYIPPHLRKAEEKVKITPDMFPALGSDVPARSNVNAWTGTKSFSSLAREWNQKAKLEKERDEYEKEREQARINREKMEQRMHVTHNKYIEDEHETNYDNEDYQKTETEQDDWTTVEHTKKKPELTIEEKIAKQEREIEEEEKLKQYEETVWESNEWDYRDRRSYT